ncbi:MAG: hypothetical protein KF894_08820, partial [Labilithrix sp.]|nr:hypothetical protein [Labilithrix sp.]
GGVLAGAEDAGAGPALASSSAAAAPKASAAAAAPKASAAPKRSAGKPNARPHTAKPAGDEYGF